MIQGRITGFLFLLNKHIHLAWFCVQEDGRRVEEAEAALHNMLSGHVPLLGVITKARADNGFRAEEKNEW